MAQSLYFSHLFVLVQDVPRIREMLEAIGIAVVYEEAEGSYLRFAGDGGFPLGLESMALSPEKRPGVEINVWVPDVDAAYEKMKAAGISGWSEPALKPWGAKHSQYQDENGIWWALFSQAEGYKGPVTSE